MRVPGFGPLTAKICILVDYPSLANISLPFTDWEKNFLFQRLRKAGINPDEVRFEILRENRYQNSNRDLMNLWHQLDQMPNCDTVLTLGAGGLEAMTNRKSIDKWQCSPLEAVPYSPVRKVMPTFSMDRIIKQPTLAFWLDVALYKVKKYQGCGVWPKKENNFYLNPNTDLTFEILDRIAKEPVLAVDIESGRGQINTVGFAWSDKDAIAINVLPDNYGEETFWRLWKRIADLIEGPAKKVMQNGIFETMYFSAYGIRMNNFFHDTMWAQKFLWAEQPKGLDSVGRLYTMMPYWKDENKADADNTDWNNIRNWEAHYRYNCLDTTGTFEAHKGQLLDIERRGQLDLWQNHVMAFFQPLSEMCQRGLPISERKRVEGQTKLREEIENQKGQLSKDINPGSAKQKTELFKGKGYKIPTLNGPNGRRESTNQLALKKLRLKYPDDNDIKILLDIAPKQKALSSYFNVKYRGGYVHYMMDGHGTETGRWSCTKDHNWEGFNAQTLPKYAKKFIEFAESEERVFIQCDLKQAESRFVAYDSADANLIDMLEDDAKDIHSYVAAEIFDCSVEQVIREKEAGDPSKRQLGKKSGHGANYSMGVATFRDSCLKEMDLVLDAKQAKKTLDAYHKLFPGIRRWHESIRNEVRRTKVLRNPMGRVRQFFGRMDDNTFREAYAFKPQSTVPDITNCLMLKLWGARSEGQFDFWFHLQCHDSITVSVREGEEQEIMDFMLDTSKWHPEIILTAGRLTIPTSLEIGRNLGELKEL